MYFFYLVKVFNTITLVRIVGSLEQSWLSRLLGSTRSSYKLMLSNRSSSAEFFSLYPPSHWDEPASLCIPFFLFPPLHSLNSPSCSCPDLISSSSFQPPFILFLIIPLFPPTPLPPQPLHLLSTNFFHPPHVLMNSVSTVLYNTVELNKVIRLISIYFKINFHRSYTKWKIKVYEPWRQQGCRARITERTSIAESSEMAQFSS